MIQLNACKNLTAAKKYPKGDVIATGSMRSQMHIVLKGEIGVFLHYRTKKERQIGVLGPGDFFGEAAFFLEKETRLTYVALENVIVLPIYKNNIIAFIKEEPELSFELMKALCRRLYDISASCDGDAGYPWASPSPGEENNTAVESVGSLETATDEKTADEKPAVVAADAAVIGPVTDSDTDANASVQALPHSGFSLFPEGHGSHYTLPNLSTDKLYMMDKKFTCPICKEHFKSLKVRPSKLAMAGTDNDMRIHYQGVEPIYYDIATCPNCLYSAISEMFEHPDKTNPDLRRELEAVIPEIGVFSTEPSSFSVFAGYYLALFCAPRCFYSPHLAIAKLLLKLMWIYGDCKDSLMAEKTAKQALDAYLYVYQHINNPPKIDQQLCIIIAELYIRLGDLHTGRSYLFKAQSNREGTPLLKNKAMDRIAEIRGMAGMQKSE